MIANSCLAVDILKRWTTVCTLVVVMAASMFSQTTQRANRITQELRSSAMVRIAGTVHPMTRLATDLGAADPGLRLESLTLSTLPGADEQKELNTLLAAQQDRKSPLFHKWLTQEEYGVRFGLTEADLSKVTGWLETQGFEVKSVAPSRNLITFSGTVGKVQSAFVTQIHQYKLNGEIRISNATEVAVPKALAGVVARVGGLSGFRPKPQAIAANPQFTSGSTGTHYLTPSDWATIYNVTPVYLAGFTGTGMHVGVIGQTYIPQSDVDSFRAAAGLNPTQLNYMCISSANCTSTAGENVLEMAEADLDVEWAGGIAQNATVDYIYASAADTTQNSLDALVYAITTYNLGSAKAVVPVLSMSYGYCESQMGNHEAYRLEVENALAQAQSQGQTVLVASGDAGAGCTSGNSIDFLNIASNGADLNWPATSPYVTAVGGTRFSGDGTDTYGDQYWSGSNAIDILGSAQKYIPEKGWNDTAADQTANPLAPLAASGGGASGLYDIPVWQPIPVNYPPLTNPGLTRIKRFVPDVAFAASADHDGYLICTPEFPVSATKGSDTTGASCLNNTFRDLNNSVTPYGGTSASTASFAGLVTLLVQKYGPMGNFNPTLYGLANNGTYYNQVFHDITSGNNNVPCDGQTNGCLNGTVGYDAASGYDLVTGLGSIDGNALFNAYSSSLAQTVTTVTAAPNSLAMGGVTSLTATVASTTSGTINGTVTFLVNGTVVGTVNNLGTTSGTNSATATATLSVSLTTLNGFIEGSNLITASYGGGTAYAGSSGTTTVASLAIPTTTVVKASLASIALGDGVVTEDFTATVTTGGSPVSGSVQFLVGKVSVGAPVELLNGVALLQYVSPKQSSGFAIGSDTVTATYIPDQGLPYGTSTGTTTVTVAGPAYTLSTTPASLTLGDGQSQKVFVNLVSTTFADKVVLTVVPSSPAITATLAYSSLQLSANDHAYLTLTIGATSVAKSHAPALPWTGGLIAFGAVLAGVPLVRRRKRAAAVLLTALAISTLLFMMSCSGSSPRNYTVTILGTGGVSTVVNVTAK